MADLKQARQEALDFVNDLFDRLEAGAQPQPEPQPEPEPTPEPEPQPGTNPDPDALAKAQARVDAAKLAVKQQEDHLRREEAAGTVASHRHRTLANYRKELEAAQAALAELTGETAPGAPDPKPTPEPEPTKPEPFPLPSNAIRVKSAAELAATIKDAKGGEVIFLEKASYGNITINRPITPALTIIADPEAKAGEVSVGPTNNALRAGGVHLKGLRADNIWFDKSDNVRAERCVAKQIKPDNCNNVVILHCRIADGHMPLRIASCANFVVSGCLMEGAREDTFRITGNSYNGDVRNNILRKNMAAKPMHGDHIQMFGGRDGMPHDILIEGNLIHDDNRNKKVTHFRAGSDNGFTWKAGDPGVPAPAQGIFMKDGGGNFKNITVRNNLLRTPMLNTIYTPQGEENFVITENAMFPVENENKQIAGIRLAVVSGQAAWTNKGLSVTKNITPMLRDESKQGKVADNFIYWGKVDADTLFEGITRENAGGDQPEHWLPKQGGGIPSGFGAWIKPTVDRLIAVRDITEAL